jgi:hypothetical protein
MRTFPLFHKVGISGFMVWMYAGTEITTSAVFKVSWYWMYAGTEITSSAVFKVKDEEMKPVEFIFYLTKIFCNKREITHFL